MVKGRRQIDDIAEGPDKNTFGNKPLPQGIEIFDAVEFDHADGAFHPHILHARKRAAGFETLPQVGCDVRHLIKPRLAREQIERGIGRGAGERVRHKGRSVHQRLRRIVGPECVEHPSAGDRRGERQCAAGQSLGQRDDVRHHAGVMEGEHCAGPAETREDLIEDQQKLVTVCQYCANC